MRIELYDILDLLNGKTDVDVVKNGEILRKIKHDDRYWEDDECIDLYSSDVEYITAVDYRTIEVGV